MGQAVVMHEPQSFHGVQTPIDAEGFSLPLDRRSPDVCVFDGFVRRLSPLERDRLMGLPDDYTRWGLYDDGEVREVAVTNRDRITGNGVVAAVTEWIGNRLPGGEQP